MRNSEVRASESKDQRRVFSLKLQLLSLSDLRFEFIFSFFLFFFHWWRGPFLAGRFAVENLYRLIPRKLEICFETKIYFVSNRVWKIAFGIGGRGKRKERKKERKKKKNVGRLKLKVSVEISLSFFLFFFFFIIRREKWRAFSLRTVDRPF